VTGPEATHRPDRHLLSERESQEIFDRWITARRYGGLEPVEHPSVHFFGGQPGAGKPSILDTTAEFLRAADGRDSVAQVIGDELRAYHPMYDALLRASDEDAAFYTDLDSGRWVEKSIDQVLGGRSHLILEGTLRRPEVTLSSAAASIPRLSGSRPVPGGQAAGFNGRISLRGCGPSIGAGCLLSPGPTHCSKPSPGVL
jgi:hypothetical protein